MARISVINKNTMARSLGRYLTLGLVGLIAYSGIGISRNFVNGWKYESRMNQVETIIKDGDFDEAKSLLDVFERNNAFEQADLHSLEARLEAEQKKARKIKLDELVDNNKYDEAQALYASLVQEGVLDREHINIFTEKIDGISPERILERIKDTDGEEKINLIDLFLTNNPNYEKSKELRDEQLGYYLELGERYFSSNASNQMMLPFLEQFNQWLRNQDRELIETADFSDFLGSARDYIDSIETDNSIEIGDRVKVMRNLGGLVGKEEKEYYFGGNVKTVPLGTEGVVVRDNYGDIKNFNVKVGDLEWKFVRREVEKIMDEHDIAHEITRIESYIGGEK